MNVITATNLILVLLFCAAISGCAQTVKRKAAPKVEFSAVTFEALADEHQHEDFSEHLQDAKEKYEGKRVVWFVIVDRYIQGVGYQIRPNAVRHKYFYALAFHKGESLNLKRGQEITIRATIDNIGQSGISLKDLEIL